ncbi:MAG: hypothetical protein EAZ43_10575 [Betaproteobacteria bacterium]|nr:MAG: hypothetical protein EAZ43_10575 [Betaproteobacteria bacterium]
MSNGVLNSTWGSVPRQCPSRSRSFDFASISRWVLFVLWSGTLLAFATIVGVAYAKAKTLDGDYSRLCNEVHLCGDGNLTCAMLRTAQNDARSVRDEGATLLPEMRVLTSDAGIRNAASAVVPVLNIFPALEGGTDPSNNSAHRSNGSTKTPYRFAVYKGGKLKRIRAKETIVSGFVPINLTDRCSGSVVNLRQFQFASGALLWSFWCSEAQDQSRTLWYMASGPSVTAYPLNLPEPHEEIIRAGLDGLANVAFDWDFGILRSYDYREGREDCGTFRAWAYTNRGWQLVERREMPLCNGLAPSDWIRTHYLPTGGATSNE